MLGKSRGIVHICECHKLSFIVHQCHCSLSERLDHVSVTNLNFPIRGAHVGHKTVIVCNSRRSSRIEKPFLRTVCTCRSDKFIRNLMTGIITTRMIDNGHSGGFDNFRLDVLRNRGHNLRTSKCHIEAGMNVSTSLLKIEKLGILPIVDLFAVSFLLINLFVPFFLHNSGDTHKHSHIRGRVT